MVSLWQNVLTHSSYSKLCFTVYVHNMLWRCGVQSKYWVEDWEGAWLRGGLMGDFEEIKERKVEIGNISAM